MRRYSLWGTVAAALLVTAPVYAADDFTDYSAVTVDWTGFYVGLHGGGAQSQVSANYTSAPFSDVSHRGSGAFGGAQIGYNFQSGAWVFGAEADIAFANISGGTDCPNPVYSCNSNVNWLGSVRARAGYAFDSLLLYGTAGLGMGGVRIETVHTGGAAIPPSGTPVNGQRKTRVGWTVGAGAELALSKNWSIKSEYAYYDLGRDTFAIDNAQSISANTRLHTFKAGVNFRW